MIVRMKKSANCQALVDLEQHIQDLKLCSRCPNMVGPVVTHTPVQTKVYIAGQAPGPREGQFGRPFAWTAGVTLFKWFQRIGLSEDQVRALTFIGAVARCFPGKTKQGADRVPTPVEIAACSDWMEREFELLQPELVIPVGRVAIEQFMEPQPLVDIIGKTFKVSKFGQKFDLIALPHPSGASTWFKREPGKELLEKSLKLIEQHPAWQELIRQSKK